MKKYLVKIYKEGATIPDEYIMNKTAVKVLEWFLNTYIPNIEIEYIYLKDKIQELNF